MTDAEGRATGVACLRCRREMTSLGSPSFRIGGTGGPLHLLLGAWAEVGESTVEFEVLACVSCGHVELQLPEQVRERLAKR